MSTGGHRLPIEKGGGFVLAHVSGLLTLANLVLAVVVGIRLLVRGWPERRLPELLLASFFLGTGFLGTLLAVSAYGAVAQGILGPADGATKVLVGLSHLGYWVGGVAVYCFTWRVFRPGARWASGLALAGSAAFLAGIALEAEQSGFAIVILPGVGYWIAFGARTGAFAWTAAESFAHWTRCRRRARLGLSEPLVANRFLLWGVWSSALFVSAWTEPVARVSYVLRAGTTTELLVDAVRPIILVTIGLTSVLAAVSFVTLALTFFPTPVFRRWLESRASAETSGA